MSSILPDYEYDIFVSYRQNDNKYDGWVTEFVANLTKELKATVKQKVSIYFDENPKDGLLETHQVDASLEKKLKALIFIPIISQTYCDPNSFAWQQEFAAFNKICRNDDIGVNIHLSNGNVSSRVLPIKIHDLDPEDVMVIEKEIHGVMRSVDFIYKSAGVNRPLRAQEEQPLENLNRSFYRDQINKVANAIKDILGGIQWQVNHPDEIQKPHPLHVKYKIDEESPGWRYNSHDSSLWKELKRRNVVRAGITYIIVAWLLIQIGDVVSSYYSLPLMTGGLILLLLGVGLPASLLLAWYYERSASGIVRIGQANTPNSLSPTQKKPFTSNAIIAVLVVLIISLYFIPGLKYNSSNGPGKSIAVLPFVNISNDPNQEYFSDGMSEELLILLTQVPELKVISRTSSFSFKGKNEDVREIGRKLNVEHILEGSVRKSDNQVRISAHLVRVEDGERIWSQSFDRSLEDIFNVQDEIGRAVVKQLQISLGSLAPTPAEKQTNIEAHNAYLKGNFFFAKRGRENLSNSIKLYREALDYDPNSAKVWSAMAAAYSSQANNGYIDQTVGFMQARKAAETAISLDPKLAAGHAALAWVKSTYDWDWQGAHDSYETAFRLDSSSFSAINGFANLNWTLGKRNQAIRLYKKGIEIEPLRIVLRLNLAMTLMYSTRHEEAIVELKKALEMQPLFPTIHRQIGLNLLLQGKNVEALEYIEQEKLEDWRIQAAALVHYANDDKELANTVLEEFKLKYQDVSSFQVAETYAFFNQKDSAFLWLEKAYELKDGGLSTFLGDPFLKSLESDSRYFDFKKKLGYPDN